PGPDTYFIVVSKDRQNGICADRFICREDVRTAFVLALRQHPRVTVHSCETSELMFARMCYQVWPEPDMAAILRRVEDHWAQKQTRH
ncbi:MAG TPA: hypothetical protein VF760_00580, partial [Xanthobacteraceae bacterium]